MDNLLLKILEQEVEKEKSKKKKKSISNLKKEKRLMHYSGWHKDDKPVTKQEKTEKQSKLAYNNQKIYISNAIICYIGEYYGN